MHSRVQVIPMLAGTIRKGNKARKSGTRDREKEERLRERERERERKRERERD
jgi:hypothetical protein